MYCASSLKSGHPLYMCCICGSHSLVIGASMGPHACGEPEIVFSSGGVCGGVAGGTGGVGALGGDSLRRVLSRCGSAGDGFLNFALLLSQLRKCCM